MHTLVKGQRLHEGFVNYICTGSNMVRQNFSRVFVKNSDLGGQFNVGTLSVQQEIISGENVFWVPIQLDFIGR